MSITPEHLLTIRRFIAAKAQTAAGEAFNVFASGIDFTGKESFWSNTGADLTTQKGLETTLVNAIWIDFLTFTDASNNPNITDDGEDDSPIITRIYQLTIFCEANNARFGEEGGIVTPDLLNNRILSVDRLIELTINALCTEFRGLTPIDALASEFVISESNSAYSQECVERDAVCDFIPGKKGRQAKLLIPVKLQLKQC